MKANWLWDTRLTEARVTTILSNEKDPRFYIYAEKLFSRIADAKTAFQYMPRHIFRRQWPVIKERVAKDRWAHDKVRFWQSVYEKIADMAPERLNVAEEIRRIRLQMGYTQKQMAEKLGVIQQYVSRLETGRENPTVDTLQHIADVSGRKLIIQLQ